MPNLNEQTLKIEKTTKVNHALDEQIRLSAAKREIQSIQTRAESTNLSVTDKVNAALRQKTLKHRRQTNS